MRPTHLGSLRNPPIHGHQDMPPDYLSEKRGENRVTTLVAHTLHCVRLGPEASALMIKGADAPMFIARIADWAS
jgi:hypothetical protein